jgi:hypothetical protein
VLDFMEAGGWFDRDCDPSIDSSDIESRSTKLRQLLRRLELSPSLDGCDRSVPNALWFGIAPSKSGAVTIWGQTFSPRRGAMTMWGPTFSSPFRIPSRTEDYQSGDHDAWQSLKLIMEISPEGLFPLRCTAPRPRKEGGGQCGNWYVQLTPMHHSCSTRCRQRKLEATSEYREKNAAKIRNYRAALKNRDLANLKAGRAKEANRGKKR